MAPLDLGVEALPEYLVQVDKRLAQLAPDSMYGIQRMLSSSGKKWRPSLVLAVAYHSGRAINQHVIDAAVAIELVHVSSLVHDDIMDNGQLRWGVPTINAQEGADYALLAGDYLQAKACALAAGISSAAGIVVAEVIMQLCEGQALELKTQFDTGRTVEQLISATKGKTSSLFIAALHLGGLLSDMSPAQLKQLEQFGENIGIAYQYVDDVHDFIHTPGSTGKSVGNDVAEGTYSLPIILSLQGPSGSKLQELLQQKAELTQILEILQADGSLDRAEQEAAQYKQRALKALEGFENKNLKRALGAVVESF